MNYVQTHNHDFEYTSYGLAQDETPGMFREAVGLFQNSQDLQDAIRDLEGTAFPRQDISVMGSRSELEHIFGAREVDPRMAMDHAGTPRQAPTRPEEKTIGAAAAVGVGTYAGAMGLALASGAVAFPAIIGAAVIGGLGGGTLGAVLTKIMGDRATRNIQKQIEKGGLLLWVRTPDEDRELLAKLILRKRGASEVHVHSIM
ncbi:MAG: hypothetical protein DI551_10500 [Micavibrio aeruginosavorus]|uniref:Uncharacterized protein n=1 Tax=Micavibrio aeruginosavorus TaxID=349221 RepID=A0A2W5MSI5_9BACT|nr:MAG: hypothetical protein DI551_10500 [Micavibrio aeruginosavorus]